MPPDAPAILRCPDCGGVLNAAPGKAGEDGRLACASGHSFPIVRGVPRFVGSEAYAASFGIEWQRYPTVQLDSANGTGISKTRFKQFTGIDPSELAGKRVLDVGCGPGRFLELMAHAGAEAWGADLSLAVESARKNLGHMPNCRVVQADLFHPPFQEGEFDFIYSFGVLHHTPDPEAAFRNLVRYLKPGGRIAVWVYGLGVSSGIRARWVPRPHQIWGPLFRLLPAEPRAAALVGYTKFALAAGSLPVLGRLLKFVFPIQDLRRAGPLNDGYEDNGDPKKREAIRLEWAEHSAFDWFTPHYLVQTPHEEVVRWARDAGLVDVRKSAVSSAVVATRPA